MNANSKWRMICFGGSLFLNSVMAQSATNHFQFEDFLIVPLRVHLLRAVNSPNVHSTLEANDIQRILRKLNRVWGQAGLHFYIESLLSEAANDPALFGEMAAQGDRTSLLGLRPTHSFAATNLFHIYYVKKLPMNGIYFPEAIFVKDTASLSEVAGGLDEPLPRVTSHELGHALGLQHRQNTTNLMASGTTGIELNEEEIQQVRAIATKLQWALPAVSLAKKADLLLHESSRKEALQLYSIIADLPLHDPRVEAAIKQLSSGAESMR
jgi:hypothetical protein